MSDTLFYRCSVCGNIVAMVKIGGGTLTCCGQPMVKLVSNSTEASTEKHIPVVTEEVGKINVTVGSVKHPMLAEHYIEWIALITDSTMQIKYLKPGMEPTAEFTFYSASSEVIYTGEDDEVVLNCEGSPCNFNYEDAPKAVVYAYCNLHGLWKKEI